MRSGEPIDDSLSESRYARFCNCDSQKRRGFGDQESLVGTEGYLSAVDRQGLLKHESFRQGGATFTLAPNYRTAPVRFLPGWAQAANADKKRTLQERGRRKGYQISRRLPKTNRRFNPQRSSIRANDTELKNRKDARKVWAFDCGKASCA